MLITTISAKRYTDELINQHIPTLWFCLGLKRYICIYTNSGAMEKCGSKQ